MNAHSNPTQDLFRAIEYNQSEFIPYYLNEGADLSAKNKEGLTPIVYAVSLSYWPIVQIIAKNNKKPLIRTHFTPDPFDFGYALTVAVKDQKFETAYTLIHAGANPNISCYNSFEGTYTYALYQAILHKNFLLTSALLKAGANPNQFSNYSSGYGKNYINEEYPLHLANKTNSPKIVALLFTYATNENNKNYIWSNQKNYSEKLPKELNPACFKEGWILKEHTTLLANITFLMIVGTQQPNSILFNMLDVCQLIFIELAKIKDDPWQYTLNGKKLTAIIHNNKKHQLENNQTQKLESIKAFIHEYRNPLPQHLPFLFGDTLYKKYVEFIQENRQSQESIALVNQIDLIKNNPEKVKEYIKDFFVKKFANDKDEYVETRAIRLLKKYELTNDNEIESYKRDGLAESFCLMGNKVVNK